MKLSNTYQLNSKFRELLSLFHKGENILYEVEESLCDSTDIYNYYTALQLDFLNENYEDIYVDLFYENQKWIKGENTIVLEALEDFINRKIAGCIDVEVDLSFIDGPTHFIDVNTKLTTPLTLDQILHRGMEAMGDFDYNAHCDKDKDILKNDFYYILKYMIYYYVACNGGSTKPRLSVDFEVDNIVTVPSFDELKKLCEDRMKEKENE